jgi:predicted secreted protein
MIKVMAASVPEREGAKQVFEKMKEEPENWTVKSFPCPL